LITLKNVSNRLWDKPILKNINWETELGQSWAILGPNGAGKTTLANLILGKLPYCGAIKHDTNISNLSEIAHVSLEQQKNLVSREEKKDLFVEYSGIEEHFLTGREFMDPKGKNPKKTLKIAKKLGLEFILENPIRFYSNGEARKTLIGKSLLSDPKLLILDEPFEGLDVKSVIWLKQTISSLIRKGLAIFLIINRIEDIIPEMTHVLCLKSGAVFAKGERAEVLTSAKIKLLYENKKFEEGNGDNLLYENEVWEINSSKKMANIDQDPVILMRKVNVRYGKKIVLENFNWTVRNGENWKIVGPNGAGKSTLLSLITADNLKVYSNEIYLFGNQRGSGESIWDIKRRIGHVSPEFQVKYRESVTVLKVVLSGFFDTVGLYNSVTGEQKETALNWMKFFEIENLAKSNFTRLSYGQQRLVLIARALVKSPTLLILDEPCQGLDWANRNRVLALIDRIGHQSETQLIYVTHIASDKLNCINHELCFEEGPSGSFLPSFS